MNFQKCFVTGCDKNTEWTLPWFLNNYKHWCGDIPIVLCDFGMTPERLLWAKDQFDDIIEYSAFEEYNMFFKTYGFRGWFNKPMAINVVKANKKFWIDTDCEILGDILPIFNELDKYNTDRLSVALDRPWTSRRGEVWHNTGVVGAHNNSKNIKKWVTACKMIANPLTLNIGDQDGLHHLATQNNAIRDNIIKTLPNKYNWLRLQLIDEGDSKDKLIMHWTGLKGKDIIARKMNDTGLSHIR